MRDIAVVTSTRADYGTMRPVIQRLSERTDAVPRVIVTGTHLAESYGRTIDQIIADGFVISDRIDLKVDEIGNSALDTARIMGRVHEGFAEAFESRTPDLLIVDGDRTEILSIVCTALPFRIPVAHLHGGESTRGAVDEQCRHAITKLSHVHFAAAQPYADRILQMGEEPWRVHVTGAPALDHLLEYKPLTAEQVRTRLDFAFDRAPLLITYHPETLTGRSAAEQIATVLAALAERPEPMIFTAPNADAESSAIRRKILEFVASRANARFYENLGSEVYWSVMAIAAAMVGNTSSGINEAPSVRVPVVNIGDRQLGRLRALNIIDVPCAVDAVKAAIGQAVSPAFRRIASSAQNPCGDGHASERIAGIIADLPDRERLLMKQFTDLPATASAQ